MTSSLSLIIDQTRNEPVLEGIEGRVGAASFTIKENQYIIGGADEKGKFADSMLILHWGVCKNKDVNTMTNIISSLCHSPHHIKFISNT